MENAIRAFAALNLLVIGVSHIVQHRAWAEFFVWLHGLGRAGAFANAFLSLFPGTLIVAFHSVWSGGALLLTLLGWAWVAKGAIALLWPEWGLRSMARVQHANSRWFVVPGVGFVVIAAVLLYSLWPQWP